MLVAPAQGSSRWNAAPYFWFIEPLLTLATPTRVAYIIHSLLSPASRELTLAQARKPAALVSMRHMGDNGACSHRAGASRYPRGVAPAMNRLHLHLDAARLRVRASLPFAGHRLLLGARAHVRLSLVVALVSAPQGTPLPGAGLAPEEAISSSTAPVES